MKGLTLTSKEQTRVQILNVALEHQCSMHEAAELLGVSERHAWRLLAAYRKEGAAALAHGNRGRTPANALAEGARRRVVALAQARYAGLNYTHLTELLAEREGLVLSRSSVRRLLVLAGLSSPRHRRSPRHRHRRQRMPQEGMLLQADGSPHAWLEDRGPRLTLLLAVDDATGTAPYALFREQEDTTGYFLLMEGIIEQRGIPLGMYTDRHAVFRRTQPAQKEGHPGAREPTQFARALRELGVQQIFAQSPEAKGRVERANGTFQDRLVAELRLAGACTLEEANRVLWDFLPRFNERFGVPAGEPGSAYRRVEEGIDLGGILCIKERRKVAKDNTVSYHALTLQLFPGVDRLSYAGARVEVQERLDGRVVVSYQKKILTPGEAPPLAAALRAHAEASAEEALRSASLPTPDPEPPPPISIPRSPLIWYEDSAMKQRHRELVKAGMERVRQEGKRIGRPRVTEREGFPEQLGAALALLGSGGLSRRRAAKHLNIGYATLKRMLDARQTEKGGGSNVAMAGLAPIDQPMPATTDTIPEH